MGGICTDGWENDDFRIALYCYPSDLDDVVISKIIRIWEREKEFSGIDVKRGKITGLKRIKKLI